MSRTPPKPLPPRGNNGRFEEKPKPSPVKYGAGTSSRPIPRTGEPRKVIDPL